MLSGRYRHVDDYRIFQLGSHDVDIIVGADASILALPDASIDPGQGAHTHGTHRIHCHAVFACNDDVRGNGPAMEGSPSIPCPTGHPRWRRVAGQMEFTSATTRCMFAMGQAQLDRPVYGPGTMPTATFLEGQADSGVVMGLHLADGDPTIGLHPFIGKDILGQRIGLVLGLYLFKVQPTSGSSSLTPILSAQSLYP